MEELKEKQREGVIYSDEALHIITIELHVEVRLIVQLYSALRPLDHFTLTL